MMATAGPERPEAAPVRSCRSPARLLTRENRLMATDDADHATIKRVLAGRLRSELS
jgi:hypothetical protein